MGHRLSLLHVEDDPEYAEFFSLYLHRLAAKSDGVSIDITAVRDIGDAISRIKAHHYDCIVSDYQIGNESGLDLMVAVRKVHPDIPVIFLTGQGDEQVARTAFVEGATDYFSKDREIIAYERIFNSILNHAALYTKRKEHDIIQALHEKEMGFLASSGLDLLHVALGADIFDTIQEHISRIIGGNIIIVSQYDQATGLFIVRTVMMGGTMAEDDMAAFLQIESHTLEINKVDVEQLLANTFVSFEMDMGIFTGGTADMEQFCLAAAAKGITRAHVMPMIKSNTLYGALVVLNPGDAPFVEKRLLEAYVIQASVAIDRHVTETNLLRQERLYHQYVETSPDPVFVTDTTGTYIDVNPAAAILTGYEKEELVGMRITALITEEYRDIARHAFNTVLETNRLSIELPITRKDGTTRWIKIDSTKLDRDRNVAFCKDITDQKIAVEQKDRLHNLLMSVRTLDQLIVRADDMGTFLQKALESLVDNGAYTSGWIVRLDENGTVLDARHHHTPCPEEFNDLLGSGSPVPCFTEALTRDGPLLSNHCETDICATCPLISTYPQTFSFTKKLVCEGDICGVMSLQLPGKYGRMEDEQRLFNDITDEIAFAMGVIADMERQAHRERALRMQRKELSDFAHIISHDVRNDLHTIKTYAEYTGFPTDMRFERISSLVDKISSFLKKSVILAESGNVVGEPELVDLQEIIESCREAFEGRGIAITNTKMPHMWTDPLKIREVFLNIIDNARRHGNATHITVSSELAESGMRIMFTDNGKGIPEGMFPSLFEWGVSSNPQNQGIGLAVIKHIVRAHDGVVAAWNNEAGATVSLRFPRESIDEAALERQFQSER